MSELRMKSTLCVLRWTLGVVILIEAILFVLPSARHSFSGTHMPDILRLILGWSEVAGSILLLIPRTAVRGAWVLVAIFTFAIATHLLHGLYNVGNLVIYAAAAWTIAVGKGN